MKQRTEFNFNPEIYNGSYDTNKWFDHIYRVKISRSIIDSLISTGGISSLADLSAGDGKISGNLPVNVHLGDISPRNCALNNFKYCGQIEDTIFDIPTVDLFVLSETLEHLEDPENVLRLISFKSKVLFLSTPLDEPPGSNPEHLWSWGKNDILEMLNLVDFKNIILYMELDFNVSRFQLWVATK